MIFQTYRRWNFVHSRCDRYRTNWPAPGQRWTFSATTIVFAAFDVCLMHESTLLKFISAKLRNATRLTQMLRILYNMLRTLPKNFTFKE